MVEFILIYISYTNIIQERYKDMKLSFSTLACPDFTWTEIYSMTKDFGLYVIEIRGLGD